MPGVLVPPIGAGAAEATFISGTPAGIVSVLHGAASIAGAVSMTTCAVRPVRPDPGRAVRDPADLPANAARSATRAVAPRLLGVGA